jgi:hypothetical protein
MGGEKELRGILNDNVISAGLRARDIVAQLRYDYGSLVDGG